MSSQTGPLAASNIRDLTRRIFDTIAEAVTLASEASRRFATLARSGLDEADSISGSPGGVTSRAGPLRSGAGPEGSGR